MIREEQKVVPEKKVAFRVIDNRVVLIEPHANALITLNETGTAVWQLLDGHSVGEIASEIAKKFGISREAAMDDVVEFLATLFEKRLVSFRG